MLMKCCKCNRIMEDRTRNTVLLTHEGEEDIGFVLCNVCYQELRDMIVEWVGM